MSTITREFTKEQLIEHIKGRKEFADECAADSTLHPERREYYELTAEALRIALASLEAEAVAYLTNSASMAEVITSHHFGGDSVSMRRVAESSKWKPLFTAPPATVSVPDEVSWEDVPEEITEDDMALASAWAHGFNQCRAVMRQGAEPDFREISNSSTKHFREYAETSTKCWCHTCRPVTIDDMRFVFCPDCGNKRCPHANDHRNACTGSNEPGQEGSAYPAAPQQDVRKNNVIGTFQGYDGKPSSIVNLSGLEKE